MKVELIRKCRPTSRTDPALVDGDGFVPIGTIIDDPDAFALVQYGNAKPADPECEAELERRGWKPHMLEPARQLQERRQQGIRDAIADGGDVVEIDDLYEESNDDAADSDK